jgi:hypothetical protein
MMYLVTLFWLLALEQLLATLVNRGFIGLGTRERVFLVDIPKTCGGAVKVVVRMWRIVIRIAILAWLVMCCITSISMSL